MKAQEAIEALKPYLHDYLRELGHYPKHGVNIKCINPSHDDVHPSMTLGGDKRFFWCFSCLPPDQEVRTDKGLVPIKNIRRGDVVHTAGGKNGVVKAVIKTLNTLQKTYTFKTANIKNDDLSFTENHHILVVRGPIHHKIPYIRFEKSRGKIKFYGRMQHRKRIKKYTNTLFIEPIKAKDVMPGDYFVFPAKTNLLNISSIQNQWKRKRIKGIKNNRIDTILLNEETMWLYGLYCAEGSGYRGGIAFSLGGHEMKYAKKVKHAIKKHFNKETTIGSYKKNTIALHCSCTDMQHIFEGMFGKLCHNKTAPQYFTELPLNLQKSFLKGVMDGDGHNGKTITVTSKNLINILQQIAVNLHLPYTYRFIPSYISKYDRKRRKPAYNLLIRKRESVACFYEKIDGLWYCLQKIKKVTQSDPLPSVYDISIKSQTSVDNNTFMCKHYAVHNCNLKGDIFTVCNILEKKPIEGQGFYQETLPHLCEKFGVPYQPEEITEEEKARLTKLRAYSDAANVITPDIHLNPPENIKAFMNERSWEVQHIVAADGGWILGREDYLQKMITRGWSADYLSSIDLDRQGIFSEGRLIFTICDQYGQPVGFAARDVCWKRGAKGPKWLNSHNSDIYKKGSTLFNLHKAKKEDPPVYAVEGYGDVVTALIHGIKNIVAIGGMAFGAGQVELLKKAGISAVILTLDGDKAGQDRTSKILKELKSSLLDITIVKIPDEKDPDEYIRSNGAADFFALRKTTPFEWKLDRIDWHEGGEKKAIEMVDTIMMEENMVKRHFMAQTLSDKTGVPADRIMEEIRSREAAESFRKRELMEDLRRQVQRDLGRGREVPSVIKAAAGKVDEIATTFVEDKPEVEFRQSIVKVKAFFESDRPKVLSLKPFGRMDEKMGGISRGQCLMALAGAPSHGKTSFLRHLAWNLVTNNEDCQVIYLNIDDSRRKMLAATVALIANRPISMVKDPKSEFVSDDDRGRINKAWETLDAIADRFIIKDATYGTTIDALETLISYMTQKNPEATTVTILDNFHKLSDYLGLPLREQIAACSRRVKKLTNIYDVPILMTVEMTKKPIGIRPDPNNLYGAVQIEYDCDVIALMYNEAHEKGHEEGTGTALSWEDRPIGGDVRNIMRPVVELDVRKNKESDWKGLLFFKFADNKSRFEDCTGKDYDYYSSRYKTALGRKAARQAHRDIKREAAVRRATEGKTYILPERNPDDPF